MKKGSKVYIIITIIFFLAMVLYAAYASLTINAEVTTNNLNITSNTYSPMVFTSVGGNSLTVNISAENMDSSNAGNYIATMSDNLTVRLDTDGKDAMCCTYNVSWEWVEDNNTLNQYTKSNTESNEFTLTGTTSGTAGTYNFTNQLPNYNASSRTTSMLSGAQICNKNSGVTAATVSQVWTFTTNFYNLNVNQDAFKGASLNGKVKITDVSCNKGESISFNIGGTSYKATQNMTWQEWVNSSNNTQGYKVKNNKIYTADNTECLNVLPTETINTSGSYTLVDGLSKNMKYLKTNNINGFDSQSPIENMYRFTGEYQASDAAYAGNVDNYICLGSNASTCPADNMYRIIGVIDDDESNTNLQFGMLKVIKNTSIGNYTWDGGTSVDDPNKLIKESNYNNYYENNDYVKWDESYLNTNILNQTYLNNLSFKNNIANVKWHCNSQTYNDLNYNFSISDEYSQSLCNNSFKISLIYASDSKPSPWLALSDKQQTMTNLVYTFDDNSNDFYWRAATLKNYAEGEYNTIESGSLLSYDNYFHAYCYRNCQFSADAFLVRPSFFLNADIEIKSGSGTYANPFRI